MHSLRRVCIIGPTSSIIRTLAMSSVPCQKIEYLDVSKYCRKELLLVVPNRGGNLAHLRISFRVFKEEDFGGALEVKNAAYKECYDFCRCVKQSAASYLPKIVSLDISLSSIYEMEADIWDTHSCIKNNICELIDCMATKRVQALNASSYNLSDNFPPAPTPHLVRSGGLTFNHACNLLEIGLPVSTNTTCEVYFPGYCVVRPPSRSPIYFKAFQLSLDICECIDMLLSRYHRLETLSVGGELHIWAYEGSENHFANHTRAIVFISYRNPEEIRPPNPYSFFCGNVCLQTGHYYLIHCS